MASYPEYDNNLMTNATTSEDRAKISRDLLDKHNKFLNRVVAGLFTPGSTVKPYVAIAALMEGIITPEKNIYSSGQLVIKNKYGGPDTVFKVSKASRGWALIVLINMQNYLDSVRQPESIFLQKHMEMCRHQSGRKKFLMRTGWLVILITHLLDNMVSN